MAPQLELELANLTRDYENNRGRYASLLAKKTDAEQAENLERAKKAEQFEILDAAQVPSEPYKPKKSSLLAFGLMIGLAIGGVLAFLKEFIHNSFYTASEIENYFGLPVLVSIPRWGMPNSPKAKGYFQKLKWILSS